LAARAITWQLSEAAERPLLAKFDRRYPSALRNLLAVRLMLECGLRCGEVITIRPEHVDMATCRLIVREGKGGKDRVVWFSDDLRDLISSLLGRRPESDWLLFTRHANLATTMIYTHEADEELERAMRRRPG